MIDAVGVAARLGVERAAGAIITDSPRIAERAALFGVPAHLLNDAVTNLGGTDIWDIVGRHRQVGRRRFRDSGSPSRLADAIVANFAHLVSG
jgi:hypothetical protein